MTKHMKRQALNAVVGAICLTVLIWNPIHAPATAWMLVAAFFFGALFGLAIKAITVEGHLHREHLPQSSIDYILSND